MWRYYCRNCGKVLEYNQQQFAITCPRCRKDSFPAGIDEIKTRFCNEKLCITKEGEVEAFPYNGKLNVKALSIPEGARNIGHYHSGSALTDNPYIEEITLPSSIESIDYLLFRGCRNLKRVTFKNNKYFHIDSWFKECESLEEVILSDGISSIGRFAFSDCTNLKKVSIPKSLWKIEQYAFSGDKVEYVVVPSVYGLEKGYYDSNNRPKFFVIGEDQKKTYCEHNGDKYYYITGREGIISSSGRIGDILYCFPSKDDKKASVTLPAGVKTIAQRALIDEPYGTVKLPSSVDTIQKEAFLDCKDLEKIVLNEGLTRIEEGAFRNKQGKGKIKEVEIPSTVKFIGKDAFRGQRIEKLVLHEGLLTIESGAFKNCLQWEIDIPRSVVSIAKDAFAPDTYLTVEGLPYDTFRDSKQYRQKLVTLSDNTKKKRGEIESKERQIILNNNSIAGYRKSIETATMNVAEVDVQIEICQRKVDEVCSIADATIDKKKSKIFEINEKIEQLNDEKCKLQIEHNNTIFLAISKKRKLESDMAEIVKECESLKVEIAAIEAEIEIENARKEEAKKELSALGKKKLDLQDSIEIARQKSETQNREITRINKEIDVLKKEILSIEDEIAKTNELLEKISSDHEEIIKERKLRAEKSSLIRDLPEPTYELVDVPSYEENKDDLEETAINEAFIQMVNQLNNLTIHNALKEIYGQKETEIQKIISINQQLNLEDYTDISEFKVLEDEKQDTELGSVLPSKFKNNCDYFGKDNSWKAFKRALRPITKKNSELPEQYQAFFDTVDYQVLNNSRSSILFFPYCVAIISDNGIIRLYSYEKTRVSCKYVDKEYKRPPKELEIVSKHYEHENLDGTPSKRYKSNPIIYLTRKSSIVFRFGESSITITIPTQHEAETIKSNYDEYVSSFKEGLRGSVYKALKKSDVADIDDIINEERRKKREQERIERQRLAELERIQKEKEIAAEKEKEEKRRALIEKQKKLNEERKAEKEREKQRQKKVFSMFEDDYGSNNDTIISYDEPSDVDESSSYEIAGNKLISNNIFKITIKRNTDTNSDKITLYFTTLAGKVISNKKTIDGKKLCEDNTIGFVLKDGIDYTEMSECILKIEDSKGTADEIKFKMNISFYSDF